MRMRKKKNMKMMMIQKRKQTEAMKNKNAMQMKKMNRNERMKNTKRMNQKEMNENDVSQNYAIWTSLAPLILLERLDSLLICVYWNAHWNENANEKN